MRYERFVHDIAALKDRAIRLEKGFHSMGLNREAEALQVILSEIEMLEEQGPSALGGVDKVTERNLSSIRKKIDSMERLYEMHLKDRKRQMAGIRSRIDSLLKEIDSIRKEMKSLPPDYRRLYSDYVEKVRRRAMNLRNVARMNESVGLASRLDDVVSKYEKKINEIRQKMIDLGISIVPDLPEQSSEFRRLEKKVEREIEKKMRAERRREKDISEFRKQIDDLEGMLESGIRGAFRFPAEYDRAVAVARHALNSIKGGSWSEEQIKDVFAFIINLIRIAGLYAKSLRSISRMPMSEKNQKFIARLIDGARRVNERARLLEAYINELKRAFNLPVELSSIDVGAAVRNSMEELSSSIRELNEKYLSMRYQLTEEAMEGKVGAERIRHIADVIHTRRKPGIVGFLRSKPDMREQLLIVDEIQNLMKSAAEILQDTRLKFISLMEDYIKKSEEIMQTGNMDESFRKTVSNYLDQIYAGIMELQQMYSSLKRIDKSFGRMSFAKLPSHAIVKALKDLRRGIVELEAAYRAITGKKTLSDDMSHIEEDLKGVKALNIFDVSKEAVSAFVVAFVHALEVYNERGEIHIDFSGDMKSSIRRLKKIGREGTIASQLSRPFTGIAKLRSGGMGGLAGRMASPFSSARSLGSRIKQGASGRIRSAKMSRLIRKWNKRLKKIMDLVRFVDARAGVDVDAYVSKKLEIEELIEVLKQTHKKALDSGFSDTALLSELDNQVDEIERRIDEMEKEILSEAHEKGVSDRLIQRKLKGWRGFYFDSFKSEVGELLDVSKSWASGLRGVVTGTIKDRLEGALSSIGELDVLEKLKGGIYVALSLIVVNFLISAISRYAGNSSSSLTGSQSFMVAVMFFIMLWEQLSIKIMLLGLEAAGLLAGAIGGAAGAGYVFTKSAGRYGKDILDRNAAAIAMLRRRRKFKEAEKKRKREREAQEEDAGKNEPQEGSGSEGDSGGNKEAPGNGEGE